MNQFFTFMVDWPLKSAATVTLGFACVLLLRNRSAATRHLIWRVTLAAVALLPIAMILAPKEGAPAVMEPIQAPVRAVILPMNSPRFLHAFANRKLAPAVTKPDLASTSGTQVACQLYAGGLAAMLAFWVVGYVRIRRIAKTSVPASGISSSHSVIVATDNGLRVPITFGLLKPVIVLPKDSAKWPEERVRAAIFHESAHIARKDWAWQTASKLVRALQWFNPAVWLMNGALNATSEAAADDEVLMQFGMGPSAYAGELLKVAAAAGGNLSAATAMARPGGVAARLRRIVAKGIDRGRPRRGLVLGLGVLFTVGAILVAAGTVAEAAGDAALSATTFASPQGVREAKLSHGGFVRVVAMGGPNGESGPLWRPDGKPATQDERTLLQPILHWASESDKPDGRVINFYLQVSKLPKKPGESENGIFRVKGPDSGWEYRAGANSFSDDGRLQWDQWVAPSRARTCDMDCAISYGPYKAIGRGRFGDGRFHAKIGDQEGNSVTVSVNLPGKSADNQAKLECFDHEGNPIPGGGESWWGNDDSEFGGQRFGFNYAAQDAKRIESFQLSTRAYEHVLIKGIRLPPTTGQP